MNKTSSLEAVRVNMPPTTDKVPQLIRAFLSGRNALTIKAYRQDLESFARFLGVSGAEEASRRLLSLPSGGANALSLAYRTHLAEAELSPATINRRLAALRALVKLARTLGLVSFSIEIQNVKTDSYKDLRGPGRATFKSVLTALSLRRGPKSIRDMAILRLLHDLGLRRGELVSLDLDHLDLVAGTISILGKGRTTRMFLTLPSETATALGRWLAIRGYKPGALFTNFDHAGKGARLTGTSIYFAAH